MSTTTPIPQPDAPLPEEANRARFELELEFIQTLANPYYLQSLSQQGILQQPEFINYLTYLTYWKRRDYAKFIQYPHALHHLDLLQKPAFRERIATDEWREYLNQKQFDHWRTWREPKQPPAQPEPPAQLSEARRDTDGRTTASRRKTPGTALSTPRVNGTASTPRVV